MLIFCHLFIGLVLGIVLLRLTRNRWALFACALGAVLPDILDKPLGHILLRSTLDNGRLWAHTLLLLAILAIIGAVLAKKRGVVVVIALAAGVLLHQLGDTMYLDPTGWFWPLFGPFQPEQFPDYFGNAVLKELGSAYEWVFGLASLAIIVNYSLPGGWKGWRALTDRSLELMPITIALFIFALFEVLYGIANSSVMDFGETGAMYIAALTAVVGGTVLQLTVEK